MAYFVAPNRKMAGLLDSLRQNQLQHTNKQLKDILAQKKAKLREMYSLSSHELLQPPLLPVRPPPHFSASIPISVQQKFISEKIKANVLSPDRMFSAEPNMKAGSFLLPKRSEDSDAAVVEGKLREYDRVVDDQSGEVKHRKLVKLAALHADSLQPARYKYRRMKQTLFHKFLPDKYNFYPNPSRKSSAFDPPVLRRSSSKYVASEDGKTIDQASDLPSSSRELRTLELSHSPERERRSSIVNKSRGKVVAQKDINSLT